MRLKVKATHLRMSACVSVVVRNSLRMCTSTVKAHLRMSSVAVASCVTEAVDEVVQDSCLCDGTDAAQVVSTYIRRDITDTILGVLVIVVTSNDESLNNSWRRLPRRRV